MPPKSAPAKEARRSRPKRNDESMSVLTLVLWAAATTVAYFAIRGLLAAQPHSGYGKSPMFGDFEAQRHWVELTNALPLKDWYVQGPHNDLQYWGLDYPPITAFHAWLTGKAVRQVLDWSSVSTQEANRTYNMMFGLKESHGSERPETIAAMHLSNGVSELLVYVPAVVVFVGLVLGPIPSRSFRFPGILFGLTLLLFPLPLLFVDYGHFQYNSTSLGLMVWATNFALFAARQFSSGPCSKRAVAWTCASIVAIVSSILFKQMSLYFALPFGGFYLGMCLRYARFSRPKLGFTGQTVRFFAVFLLFVVVGVGFAAVVFWPFVATSTFDRVIGRMFPFGRGLYEDKVANVWCAVSPVFKLQRFVVSNIGLIAPRLADDKFLSLSHEEQQAVAKTVMAGICAVTTLLCSVPVIIAQVVSLSTERPEELRDENDVLLKTDEGLTIDADCLPSKSSFFYEVAELLVGSVFSGSMAFYLFAFQVHEKSILLPLMPSVLWVVLRVARHLANAESIGRKGVSGMSMALRDPWVAAVLHFQTIALFSLFPLAIKDDLVPAYAALQLFLASVSMFFGAQCIRSGWQGVLIGLGVFLSVVGMGACLAFYAKFVPPPHLPDINTMVVTIYAAAHFVLYFAVMTLGTLVQIPFVVVFRREELPKRD